MTNEFIKLAGKVYVLEDGLKTRDGKPRFLFHIEDCPHEFSGWGVPYFKEGDNIEFEYSISDSTGRKYYNFKRLTKDNTPPLEEIHEEDARVICEANPDYVLMLAAVNLSVARTTSKESRLTDSDIYECYNHLKEYIHELQTKTRVESRP